jgi:hypothetical protein
MFKGIAYDTRKKKRCHQNPGPDDDDDDACLGSITM